MTKAAARKDRRVIVPDATSQDAEAITRALGDPATRALCITIGMLLPLAPTGRARVLAWLQSKLDDDARQPPQDGL
jgi:hypothetical protein